MKLDLSSVPTPQLLAIRKILTAGVAASAEKDTNSQEEKTYLCHESPPKGYPEDKAEYGDPACYRYPLNTKARCLAAWRYVHQQQNKDILGSKWSKVVSKIKSYAKKNYDLELETGEAELVDWEQAFVEYYDEENNGGEPNLSESNLGESNLDETGGSTSHEVVMDDNLTKIETELKDTKAELETVKSDLQAKATELADLTKQLTEQTVELEALRKFKQEAEEAEERARKIGSIKAKLDEAGIKDDIDSDPDYWLGMSDETLEKTIARLKEANKASAEASASVIKVPRVGERSTSDIISVVTEGLKEHKKNKEQDK
jgi:chromosome segregation ATPase